MTISYYVPGWATTTSSSTSMQYTLSTNIVNGAAPPSKPKSELDLLDDRIQQVCRAGRKALGT